MLPRAEDIEVADGDGLEARCTGRMTRVALIRDAAVVGRILRHLGLPDVVPVARAGRAPPLPWQDDAVPEWSGVD